MLKAIQRSHSALQRLFFPTICFNCSSENQLPIISPFMQQFSENCYGIQFDKHILPHRGLTSINIKQEQLKYLFKKIPSHIVVLIKRTEDDFTNSMSIQDEFKRKYYDICTYCEVKPNKDHTSLEGLYRVKVHDIKPIEVEKTWKNLEDKFRPREGSEQEQANEEEEEDEEYYDDEEDEEQEAPTSLVSLNMVTTVNKKKLESYLNRIYHLSVKKIDEVSQKIDYEIEIRLRFLIDSYKALVPGVNKNRTIFFNYFEASEILFQVTQHMSNENNKPNQIQKILAANNLHDRMDLLLELLKKTKDWKTVYRTFEKVAENNIRNKKFYEYYTEIMKIAKQNIQGQKGKELFLNRVSKQFNKNNPPKEIKQAFETEKQKYVQIDENSMQSGVIKKYLEDLSKIPYNVKSDEIYDLEFAEKVLDEQHYGMKEVKDAILEIIAVGKLRGTLKGKIFCLIGGPGLGKTTIASSVAKALGRKFYNISLGGVVDSSVLKGHRRTYIGAYAGKIIEALKSCEANNPVILLDEIDKMGSSYHGDPRSQLLQILDPNQNSSFVDNYIDLSIDLSNVMFICSANYEKNISKPLLDRMEKIRLNSYTDEEKRQILKRHLIRRAIDKTGITQEKFILNDDAIEALLYDYSLGQPGVRRLEKNIEKILEKIALKVVMGQESMPITITKANLRDFLGNSFFQHKDHSSITKGVAISLGGGNYSSRLTYIEAFKKSYAGKKVLPRAVMFTGSLGDVFKEAMNISYTFARNYLKNQLDNTYLFENEVHIHAPSGAMEKDGATDSITITTALVSLALQQQVRKGIAMSGELTLHGKVLRTGGIKEKILLAKREKIPQVILPSENISDVEMLPIKIKEGITFHYVEQYREAFNLLFIKQQVQDPKEVESSV